MKLGEANRYVSYVPCDTRSWSRAASPRKSYVLRWCQALCCLELYFSDFSSSLFLGSAKSCLKAKVDSFALNPATGTQKV